MGHLAEFCQSLGKLVSIRDVTMPVGLVFHEGNSFPFGGMRQYNGGLIVNFA
jgi:hypothetical protein